MEKCGDENDHKHLQQGQVRRDIRKRQIDASLFTDYIDPDTFVWTDKHWNPKEIPYYLGGDNEVWINKVKQGLQMLMAGTCITFKEFKSHTGHQSIMQFFHWGKCESPIGRQNGGNQIQVGNCAVATIAHETMHSLGFRHEMTRNDRDDFLWIRHDAVEICAGCQGACLSTYNGADKCPSKTLLSCAKNGAYRDPKDCSRCRCPEWFTGERCDVFERGETKCHSGRFTADIYAKYIETSDAMTGSRKCMWSIKTPQRTQAIIIRVIKLANFDCSELCGEDNYLEIHMKRDRTSRGVRLCCDKTLPHIFTLERGVDALIGLKRSSDNQQFQISYETPDAIEPEKPLNSEIGCFCDRVFNPWHQPGEKIYDSYPNAYYMIGIKSRSNLIINGNYTFYTQNGTAWFERYCMFNMASGLGFGVWTNPDDGKEVRIDHIVAEDCVTEYGKKGNDCAEMSSLWKKFIDCVNDAWETPLNRHQIAEKCIKEGEDNFRLKACTISDTAPVLPIEPGVQDEGEQ